MIATPTRAPDAALGTPDGARARMLVRTGLAAGPDGVRIAWEEFGIPGRHPVLANQLIREIVKGLGQSPSPEVAR